MKRIVLLLSMLVITVILTGCDINVNVISSGNSGKKYKAYIDLTYDELEQKLANKETFVFVIGREGCSACATYKVTMEKIIKENNIPIYYVQTNELSEEENNKLSGKFYFQYTPTTIFIKDGVEKTTYDRFVGAVDAKEVIKKLEKYNLLGEE